jgi:hypothetical protein
MTKAQELKKQENITRLTAMLGDNRTVYVNLHKAARSGTSRTLSLHIVTADGLQDITYLAAPILGETFRPDGTIRVTGCGMDMGFATVYSLSYALYGKGIETGNHKQDGPYRLQHKWM